MNAITVLSVAVCLAGVSAGAIDASKEETDELWTNNATRETSSEDRMKDLRIEMVKLQILSKLNMKNPPPSVPSDMTKETIDILLQVAEQREQVAALPADMGERLVIQAKSIGAKCSQHAGSSCRKFQFDMPTDMNSSTVGLWIFVKNESLSEVLSLSVSNFNSKTYKRYFRKVESTGWIEVDLPEIELPQTLSGGFLCTIELFGPVVENQGERRPFLLVNKLPKLETRKRRDVSCDSNETCCWRPLSVSLDEIGFTWVLYPVQLEVNMCTGKCRMDHSEMKTHYERAMTKVLENDSTLHDHLGACWTLCCKPKQMDPLRVIYRDSEGIIHDQHIPELTVTSCTCS